MTLSSAPPDQSAPAGAVLDDESLFAAARFLVDHGSVEQARKLLRILARRRVKSEERAQLSKVMPAAEFRGSRFNSDLLREVRRLATSPDASPGELIYAADALTVWGAFTDSALALERLREFPDLTPLVGAIGAAGRQLKASGTTKNLVPLGASDASDAAIPREALLSRGTTRPELTLVVFLGAVPRFWLSVHVVHHYLQRTGANIIYLADLSATMYLNGLATVAPGYGNLIEFLQRELHRLGGNDLHVMATSAGGFIGLRAASELGASRFAGFSIRTNLANGRERLSEAEQEAIDRCTDPDLLIDLRAHLEQRPPLPITLFAGGDHALDRAHADHMAGLPGATIRHLDGYAGHDTVAGLIWRKAFESVLDDFVAAEPAASA